MGSLLDLHSVLLGPLGFAGLDLKIAPADDMYRWAVEQGGSPELAPLEYLRAGQESLVVLEHLLHTVGRSLSTEERVLEFAAGYGRLTRWLAPRISPARLDVSDVLAPAVAFARSTFGVGGFVSETDPDALELPHRYSLIHVGSLFSHLPRHRFVALLRRLYGALLPDGLLVFSTHGTGLVDSDEAFVFRTESESDVLDKAEYGATFVHPDEVRRLAEEAGVAHVVGLERELWDGQDLYVASRGRVPGLDGWTHANVARGRVTKVEVDTRRGHAWVGGFVRLPRGAVKAHRVKLVVGSERLAPVEIEAHLAPDETSLEGTPLAADFVQHDWYVEGPFAGLPPGAHALVATVELSSGVRQCFDAVLLGAGEAR